MTVDTTQQSGSPGRGVLLRRGVRLEIFSLGWMVVEAAVAIGAGVIAGSLLLLAFGLDSVIELVSATFLLWRLSVEAHQGTTARVEALERQARWVVAVTLSLLCVYVFVSAAHGLFERSEPERSAVGLAISAAAVVIMPYLGIAKRRLASRLGSAALRGDAAESFTCAYMAATVFVGLALNAFLGWWWAEYVAALVFLFWLVGETREALQEAANGGDAEDGEDE